MISKTSCFGIIWLFITLSIFLNCSRDKVVDYGDEELGETAATLSGRIEGNNEFAFKLYQQLTDSDENLIISPHSISTCFGMAYAGARGTTEKEIADVLCFQYPPVGFHSTLKQLNDLLTSRQELILNIANAIWGSTDTTGFTYLPSYLDTISVNYGAHIEYLDFCGHSQESCDIMNKWIRDNTGGFIDNLIPCYEIDCLTYLVLANTVYFKARWLHCFDPQYTSWSAKFTKLDGSEIFVQMMNGEDVFPYYEGNGYRAAELPYKGEECSMLLVLPDEGNFSSFEANFNTDQLDSIISNLKPTYIILGLPRFSFYSNYSLDSTLVSMGMVEAFVPGANFSGMDGTDDGMPWIDFVNHQAFIRVDEWGTLATAATVMELTVGEHPGFYADRPFLFFIRDRETDTILFMGRVLHPNRFLIPAITAP